ncbi:CBS domain containing-hemolysin-like protein [Sinobaca qinghaiensis]|uniref:CBS domain containing-hemolysin-like protein n=1 Tax=Sinobaca qinghaiensis TaxID=342944 RepID=A0A419V7M0_9BACL|nr:hemolysin family protein [Sinobaca qinghaiensis]RKD76030.1 CBS domain containing-hemolysin-like protein [Sinobaca qinghaiensis]
MTILNLFFVAALIALTAFFVATEFAIVKVRSSQLDQLIAEGKPRARAAKHVTDRLDEYLSACQLGITITALGLGWLGEPTVERLLHPLIEPLGLPGSITTIGTFLIAFLAVTFLHVVVGELAPKTLAIQKAQQVTLLTAKPIRLFYRIMFPFIWFLNGSARQLTKMVGLKPMSENEGAHSEEELKLILSDSYEKGEINQSEFSYVNRIFEFDNRLAKEIMVPRTEMTALSVTDTLKESVTIMTTERFTRYPLLEGDKDHIIGMVHARDILSYLYVEENHMLEKERPLEEFVRPVIQMLETVPISKLLLTMQKERTHMAILLDEFGGTAGLVTAEDIIEEIVGEIQDEFDMEEHALVEKLGEDHYKIDGKVLIEEINELLAVDIMAEDVDTIGGWVFSQKYDVAEQDRLLFQEWIFQVNEMDNHQIKTIEIRKADPSSEASSGL